MIAAAEAYLEGPVADQARALGLKPNELLAANNYPFTECEVLCVELIDTLKLKDVLGALLAVEINIHEVAPESMAGVSAETNCMGAIAKKASKMKNERF